MERLSSVGSRDFLGGAARLLVGLPGFIAVALLLSPSLVRAQWTDGSHGSATAGAPGMAQVAAHTASCDAATSSPANHHHGHHHDHSAGGHHGWNGWGGSWLGGANFTVIAPGACSSFVAGGFPGYFPGYVSGCYPGYWGSGWYGARYGYGYPYCYYPPPLVVPAELIYGPLPAWNMLGVGWNAGIAGAVGGPELEPVVVPAAVQPANNAADGVGEAGQAPQAAAQPVKLRKSSATARARAQQLLAVADADFRAQKYVEAASRYRRATQTAPDLAEAYFRKGQAEIALSRYESAADSCKRALEVDPAWPKSNLRLANLYGGNQAAKAAHVEKLAQQAAANPNDTNLRFLIGIELFFDGQLDRAKKFFQQAAALNPGDDAHLLAFLQEIDRREPPKAAAGAIDL